MALYEGTEALLYVIISTGCWFFVSHVVRGERLVLMFFPKVIASTLLKEAKDARERLKGAKHPQLKSDLKFLVQLQNRSAGVLNSVISVLLALWCTVFDRALIDNKMFGISRSWLISGSFISGYFIWDLIVILRNYNASPDNWQWLFHAVLCLITLSSPFFAGFAPMSYYGALFLYLEASSPFMGIRWYCLKTMQILESQDGSNETEIAYVEKISGVSSLLFAVVFFFVRIIFAPMVILVPLLQIFLSHPEASNFNSARWWMYTCSIPAFFLLNVFWMFKIAEAALKEQKHKTQ